MSLLKRVFDVVASGIALLALAPIFLLIGLLVKADSRGPVFYRQERVGLRGRSFLILKFRTMEHDADRKGPAISIGDDPRITRVGHFLRRFELDELPTLVNVFRGDMSIVGPRPEVPKYLPHYTGEQRRIFSVRPGMTDLGTLRFRDEARHLAGTADPEQCYVTSILPDKLALGLEYVDRRSFWFDLQIILRTLAQIVVQKKG